MNENGTSPTNDERILAALRAVNPPLEKLMAERLMLRQEHRQTKAELDETQRRMTDLVRLQEVEIPRYVGGAKLVLLCTASLLLAILAFALFYGFLEIKLAASLFASLIVPLWLVDRAERSFGRWQVALNGRPVFIPVGACGRTI